MDTAKNTIKGVKNGWIRRTQQTNRKGTDKMSVRIIFKNGFEFTVKCETFTVTRDGLNEVTGYKWEGVTENKSLYFDMNEILAVIRIMSDEQDESGEKENG